MVAWIALTLAIVSLLVWVAVFLVGRKLYLQARPILSMLGLGAIVGAPAGPPAGEGPAATGADPEAAGP